MRFIAAINALDEIPALLTAEMVIACRCSTEIRSGGGGPVVMVSDDGFGVFGSGVGSSN